MDEKTDRLFLGVVVVIAALTAVMHVLGATSLQLSFWGVHVYAFFHAAALMLATAALLVATTLVALRSPSIGNRLVTAATSTRRAPRSGVVLTIGAVAGAVVMWLARTRHTYLGDGNVLLDRIPAGEMFHPREPLTAFVQQQLYRFVSPMFAQGERRTDWVVQDALALGSVVAGVVFIVIAWLLARELVALRRASGDDEARRPTAAIFVWLLLFTQGYIQLFFGYVENYTFYTAALALYLWLSLRYARGASPLALPALALLLAMALHLTGIILLPSLALLAMWGVRSPEKRVGALRDVGLFLAVFVGMHFALRIARPDYNLITTLADLTGMALTRKVETVPVLSAAHVRDFFNEQFLIGPLGLFLFVPACWLALRARSARAIAGMFLLVLGASYLTASWFAGDSNLGYARDWDVRGARRPRFYGERAWSHHGGRQGFSACGTGARVRAHSIALSYGAMGGDKCFHRTRPRPFETTAARARPHGGAGRHLVQPSRA